MMNLTQDADTEPTTAAEQMQLTEQDVVALMKIILDRSSEFPQEEQIIPGHPQKRNYMTFRGLKREFLSFLSHCGGRCSVDKAAQFLGVSGEDLLAATALTTTTSENDEGDVAKQRKDSESSFHSIKSLVKGKEQVVEFVTHSYLQETAAWIEQKLASSETGGCIPVQQLIHSLPLSEGSAVRDNALLWLELLGEELKTCGVQVRDMQFISRPFWKGFCVQVYEALAALESKIPLEEFAQERSWEHRWVMEALSHPPDDDAKQQLPPGEVHGHFYIPQVHKQRQQEQVSEAFRFHGFVAANTMSSKVDLSQSQIVRLLEHQFGEDAQAVQNTACVVSRPILAPWLELMHEAETSKSWCEFVVPLELVSACGGEVNFREHLQQQLASTPKPDLNKDNHKQRAAGALSLASSDGNALYVSGAMLETLIKVGVPPIIATFAVEHASSLLPKETKSKEEDKSMDFSFLVEEDNEQLIAPPAETFVKMVLSQYPEMNDVADNEFENVEGGDDTHKPLADICQRVFVANDHVKNLCVEAMRKELTRLERQRNSGGAIHAAEGLQQQADAASDGNASSGGDSPPTDEILVSFEDPLCFTAACFQIQSIVKFHDYALNHAMESMDQLQDEIRHCAFADFTRRVHQYCLSTHEDLPPFVFFFRNAVNANRRLRLYCSAMDVAAPRFGPPIEVTCSPDPDTGNARDPAKMLCDLLPGGPGQALSRQYELCGVFPTTDEGATSSSSLSDFMKHIEENTLTICGLPFKKLDKKQEKNYLTTRRQLLRSRLEEATDPALVLELTIMILYQAVKNLCVAGTLLRGPVLALLVQERKIHKPVQECLTSLAAQLDQQRDGSRTSPPDRLLVESVRGCGLCKDIAKHVVG